MATVVATDPAELRQWAGVWVGAWGGTLKHILLVESVSADGSARVVYAIGDNPWFGIRRAWSRHEATVSGRRLTISEAGFSATYDLSDRGGLSATSTRGTIVSHAAMTKTDLATLTVPGAVVAVDSRQVRALANRSDRGRQAGRSGGGDLPTQRSGAVSFGVPSGARSAMLYFCSPTWTVLECKIVNVPAEVIAAEGALARALTDQTFRARLNLVRGTAHHQCSRSARAAESAPRLRQVTSTSRCFRVLQA